jgi:hypothetical protein
MARYSDYQAAIGRGVAWLLGEQRSDGSFSAPDEGVDSFYKIPYAFGVTGQAPAAQRLLDWVARELLLLPLHPALSDDDLADIVTAVRKVARAYRR